MQELFIRVRETLADLYDVRRVIGSGGMATVFEAWDQLRDTTVAVKVLKPQLAEGVPRERFRREVAVASQLAHPNIVPIVDDGEIGGIVYYVMPLIHGESLRHRLIRSRSIPLPDAVQIGLEIVRALEYAHQRGVMHRDVKPENILLSDGHALMTDFGIARIEDGERLTVTGTAIGTPHYMSPEQATGKPVDARTDLYSLGCVLYEMIAGHRPFDDLPSPFARDFNEPIEAPSLSASTEVPPVLDDLVVRALAWNPDDRHETAGAMRAALETAQEATGLPAPPRSRGKEAVRGWAMLGTVAAGLVTAGFIVSRLVGPGPGDLATVSLEPLGFVGPPRHGALVGQFTEEARRTLGSSVGIEVLPGGSPAVEDPDYVLTWTLEVDGTTAPPTGRVTAQLTIGGNGEVVWHTSTNDIAISDDGIPLAGAALAQDIASAIRDRGRQPH